MPAGLNHLPADGAIIMPKYFTLEPADLIGSGPHRALDIRGASKDGFAPAILFSSNGGDNQMFELRPTGETDAAGNNFVWIIAKHSGMALSVPLEPRFDKGAQVFQEPLLTGAPGREGDVQKWLQSPGPRGQGIIFGNKWSSLVLDVQGSSTNDNTPIIQWDQTNNPNQLWFLFQHIK
jgi:hypothetical protein